MSLRARKLAAYVAAVSALLAVFALYARPDIMVALADQMWACFN